MADNASASVFLLPLGDHQGKPPIPLARPVTLVGARHNAHLHLLSRQVSKAHALIVCTHDQYYIRDLASRSHVYINGQEIREKVLAHRDLVKIGSFVFKYSNRANRGGQMNGPAAGSAQLRVLGGQGPIEMDGRVMLIGRRSICDVPLMEESVSTAHAVMFEMNGKHWLRDLGSRTGTFLNGQSIHQAQLKSGDQIRIGETDLVYEPRGKQAQPEGGAAVSESMLPLELGSGVDGLVDDLPELTPQAMPAAATAAATAVAGAPPVESDNVEAPARQDTAILPALPDESDVLATDDAAPTAASADKSAFAEEAPSALKTPVEAPEPSLADDLDEPRLGDTRTLPAMVEQPAPTLPLAPDAPVPEENQAEQQSQPEQQPPAADEVLVDELPADELLADELPADELLADELPADELLADELPAGPQVEDAAAVEQSSTAEVASSAAEETPAEQVASAASEDDVVVSEEPAAPSPAVEEIAEEQPAPQAAEPEPPLAEDEPIGRLMVDADVAREETLSSSATGAEIKWREDEAQARREAVAPSEAPITPQVSGNETDQPASQDLREAAPLLEQAAQELETDQVDEQVAQAPQDDEVERQAVAESAPVELEPEAIERAKPEEVEPEPIEINAPAEIEPEAVEQVASVEETKPGAAQEVETLRLEPVELVPAQELDLSKLAEADQAAGEEVKSEPAAEHEQAFEEADSTGQVPLIASDALNFPSVAGSEPKQTSIEPIDLAGPQEALPEVNEPLPQRAKVRRSNRRKKPISTELQDISASAMAPQVPALPSELTVLLPPPAPSSESTTLSPPPAPSSESATLSPAPAGPPQSPALSPPGEKSPFADKEQRAERKPTDSPVEIIPPTLPEPQSAQALAETADEVEPAAPDAAMTDTTLGRIVEDLTAGFNNAPVEVEAEPQAAEPQAAEPQAAESQAVEPQAAESQAAEAHFAEPHSAELDEPQELTEASSPGVVGQADGIEPPPIEHEERASVDDAEAAAVEWLEEVEAPEPIAAGEQALQDAQKPVKSQDEVKRKQVQHDAEVSEAVKPQDQAKQEAEAVIPQDEAKQEAEAVKPQDEATQEAEAIEPQTPQATVGPNQTSFLGGLPLVLDLGAMEGVDGGGAADFASTGSLVGAAGAQDIAPQTEASSEEAGQTREAQPPTASATTVPEPTAAVVSPVDDELRQLPDIAGDVFFDAHAEDAVVEAAEPQAKSPAKATQAFDGLAMPGADVFSQMAQLEMDVFGPAQAPRYVVIPPLEPGDKATGELLPAKRSGTGAAIKSHGTMLPPTLPMAPAAPAKKRKRLWGLLGCMFLCMALAFVAIAKLYPRQATVEGVLVLRNFSQLPPDKKQAIIIEHKDLMSQQVRTLSKAILKSKGVSAGFIDDLYSFYGVDRLLWEPDGRKDTVAYRFEGATDEANVARVQAIVQALYTLNSPRLDQLREARRKLEQLQADEQSLERRLEDAKDRADRLKPGAQGRQEQIKRVEDLKMQHAQAELARDAGEAQVKELSAAVERLERVSAEVAGEATADQAPVTDTSDAQLAQLAAEQQRLKRRLTLLHSPTTQSAEAARKALDAAMDQFQQELAPAADEPSDPADGMKDYLQAARQLQEQSRQLVGKLINEQQQTFAWLGDLKSKMDERQAKRQAEVWSGDAQLKQLTDLLAVAVRQYNAAKAQGGGETAAANARMEELQAQVAARKGQLGADRYDAETAAQFQQLIDRLKKSLQTDRREIDEQLDQLQKSLVAAQPTTKKLTEAQQAKARRIAKQTEQLAAARAAYSAAMDARTANLNVDEKQLLEELAAVESKLAAKQKELSEAKSLKRLAADESAKRLGEARAQLRMAQAKYPELQAAAQRAAGELAAAQKAVDTAGRDGEARDAALVELTGLQKQLLAAREQTLTQQRRVKNMVEPREPEEQDVRQFAAADHRGVYAAGAAALIALLFSGLIAWVSQGGAPAQVLMDSARQPQLAIPDGDLPLAQAMHHKGDRELAT